MPRAVLALTERSNFPAPVAAPRRVRLAVVGLAGLLAVASIIGMALSPYLLVEHPLLLVALSPVGRHVALAVPSANHTLLVLVTVARRVVGESLTYGIGAVYGYAAVRWMHRRYPRLRRLLRFVEAMFARFGAPLLLLAPSHSLALLAGASRVRIASALSFLILGELAWVIGAIFFGHAISGFTRVLTAFISSYPVETTAACVLLVGARLLFSWRKRRVSPAAPE
jgi:membrane protein DedA with SNARE-associated domain